MCGIAGTVNIFSELDSQSNKYKFDKAYNFLRLRGPDNKGIWYDKNSYFLHTRLKIIDLLETSDQPMKIGSYIICYNGEIYNFKEIKKKLLTKGYLFKSTGDTEVLLTAWIEWKEKVLDMLDGMFAFSIWDYKEKLLFLARDRFGKKPLVYANVSNTFSFASDVAALKEIQHSGGINREAVKSLFRFRYISEPMTIYDNFKKLPPGSYLIHNKYGTKICKYFSLAKVNKDYSYNKDATKKDITKLIISAVEKRLLSDVPLGVFLSGGIDSGLILGALSKLGKKIPCFTVGFSDVSSYYNEIDRADKLTKYLGFKHHKIFLTPNKTINSIEEILRTSDEPFADSSSIPMFLVANKSSKYIKVALTGDGGDEIFGGYRKYISFRWKKLLSLFSIKTRNLLATQLSDSKENKIKDFSRKIKRILQNTNIDSKIMQLNFLDQLSNKEYFCLFGDKKKSTIDNNLYNEIDISDDINLTLARDMQLSLTGDMLVKLDRYSMANQLEIRSPFLDKDLVSYAFSVPGKEKVGYFTGKKILKNNISSLLPQDYIQLPKKGFEIPLDTWLKKDLKYLVEEATSKRVIKSLNIYQTKIIKKWKDEFYNGRKDHSWKLWTLIAYAAWAENNKLL